METACILLGQAGIREVCFAKWCGAPRGGAHPVFFEAKNSKWIITESPSRQLAASKTPVGPPVPLAIFPGSLEPQNDLRSVVRVITPYILLEIAV